MAKCEATTRRSGGRLRCQREAVRDGACEYPDHQLQVREQRAAAAASDELSDGAQGEIADRVGHELAGTAAERPDAAPRLDELPEAPAESMVDQIAAAMAGSAAPTPEPAAFARQAEQRLGVDLGEADAAEPAADPFQADAAATDARADIRSALREPGALAERFTPQRCRRWIVVLVAPKFRRDGKDELEPEEIDEGAELAAAWLRWVLGEWAVNSLPGQTFVWLGMVYGTRYAEEILGVAARAGRALSRRMRGLTAPVPADPAPPAAAAAPAPPQQPAAAAGPELGVPRAEWYNPAFAPPAGVA